MAIICTEINSVQMECLPLTYKFDFVDSAGVVIDTMSGLENDAADVSIVYVISGTMGNFEVDETLLTANGISAIKRTVSSATCLNYSFTDTILVVAATAAPVASVVTDTIVGNLIATHTSGATVTPINETITTLVYDDATKVLTHTDETGASTPSVITPSVDGATITGGGTDADPFAASSATFTAAGGDFANVLAPTDAEAAIAGAGQPAGTLIEFQNNVLGVRYVWRMETDGTATQIENQTALLSDQLNSADFADPENPTDAEVDTVSAGDLPGTLKIYTSPNGGMYVWRVNSFGAPQRIEQPPDSDPSSVTAVVSGHEIATHDDGEGNVTSIQESVTTSIYNSVTKTVTITNENGTSISMQILPDSDGTISGLGTSASPLSVLFATVTAAAGDFVNPSSPTDVEAAALGSAGNIVEYTDPSGNTFAWRLETDGSATLIESKSVQVSRVEVAPDDTCRLRHVNDLGVETARWLLREASQVITTQDSAIEGVVQLDMQSGTTYDSGVTAVATITNPSACRSMRYLMMATDSMTIDMPPNSALFRQQTSNGTTFSSRTDRISGADGRERSTQNTYYDIGFVPAGGTVSVTWGGRVQVATAPATGLDWLNYSIRVGVVGWLE